MFNKFIKDHFQAFNLYFKHFGLCLKANYFSITSNFTKSKNKLAIEMG